MDELLDIVDMQDRVIGCKMRSEVYHLKMKNFRMINAFARDNEGRLWIPRRSAKKKFFPTSLDMSVSGHVKSGEEYDNAFWRELSDELSIVSDKITYTVLGALSPYVYPVSAFMKVYEFTIDYDPTYNHNEFSEFFWLNPADIALCIAAGERAKSDLPILLNLFYR